MKNLLDRAVADKNVDEAAWLRARRQGVTATEVSKLVKGGAYATDLVKEKISGERTFFGNQYTEWGLTREPVIVEKVLKPQGFFGSDVLYHANDNPRHLATPDGLYLRDGFVIVAEIKTSKNDLHPSGDYFSKTNYYDQIQWQIYVAGDDCMEALFVWETHDDQWPEPTPGEPQSVWIDRDQYRINKLIEVANEFLHVLDNGFEDDPEDYAQLVYEYTVIKKHIAEWATRLADVEDAIRLRIGERSSFAIDTEFGRVSLSTPKPSERFDSTAFKTAQPELFKQYVKISQSKPSLRITAAKEGGSDVL